MLATVLKNPKATETIIAIVEMFAKIRELSGSIDELSEITEKDQKKVLIQKSGKILAEVLEAVSDETTLEINLVFVKIKYTTKLNRKNKS
jgi:hypothetical protein